MKLKLLKEVNLEHVLSEKHKQQLKMLGEVFGAKDAPLSKLYEMFNDEDKTITPADYNVWLDQVVSLCKEQNKKPHSKRNFIDCAFEVLDNDPKMDLYMDDDIETIKQKIVDTLWNAFQASRGHEKLEAMTKRSKKAREEEEMKVKHPEGSWTDEKPEADDDNFSEDDINVMTNKYPEEDLGDWDVPRRAHREEEQESEFSHLFKQSVGLEDEEEMIDSPAYKAGYEAGIANKGKNPYHKNTARYRMWERGYKAGCEVAKPSYEENEETASQKALLNIQNDGYLSAKHYFAQVAEATKNKKLPPAAPQNPHPRGTSAAEAWETGFDKFVQDIQDR